MNESHYQRVPHLYSYGLYVYDIVPCFSSTLRYSFYSADFFSSSGARHCCKRAAPNTSTARKVPSVQTTRRKVHSLLSCFRFLLFHEYFIQRRSCLPEWKTGEGGGVVRLPCRGKRRRPTFQAHMQGIGWLTCRPHAGAQSGFLLPNFFVVLFWSCLTLRACSTTSTNMFRISPPSLDSSTLILTRCYVRCLPCWGWVLSGLHGAALWWQSARTCVKHLWTCQPLWACVWPRCDIIPRSHINSFHSILSPHPLFIYLFFFSYPFAPCSMYLHHSGLLVGLVFPTFPAMWNKTGKGDQREMWGGEARLRERKRRWMQNRLRDAGREGAETVPEQGSRELV